MQKKRIGYVNEAFYFYFRHSGATTAIGNHPYYCFDHFLYFFHLLSETYRLPDGSLDRVAQALLLYNFNWRLKGDVLFPYHYEGKAFERAVNQLRFYVNLIDDDVILTSPHVDRQKSLGGRGARRNHIPENAPARGHFPSGRFFKMPRKRFL